MVSCIKSRPGFTDELRSREVQQKVGKAKEYGSSVLQEGFAASKKLSRWLRGDGPKNEI
jgi:hypothetical protein